jgi:hypothetical protein
MAEIKLSTLAETEKRRQGGDMFVSFGERGVGGKGANRSAHQTCTGRTQTHNDLALSGPTQQSKIAMRDHDQHQKMHPVSHQSRVCIERYGRNQTLDVFLLKPKNGGRAVTCS